MLSCKEILSFLGALLSTKEEPEVDSTKLAWLTLLFFSIAERLAPDMRSCSLQDEASPLLLWCSIASIG